MKGGGVSSTYHIPPSKRRWRGLAVAVFGLVVLSMLVPLVFLLGIHSGFQSTGFGSEDRSSTPSHEKYENYDPVEQDGPEIQSEGDKSTHLDKLMQRLEPALQKDAINFVNVAANKTVREDPLQVPAKPKTDSSSVQTHVPKLPPQKTEKRSCVVAADMLKSRQLEANEKKKRDTKQPYKMPKLFDAWLVYFKREWKHIWSFLVGFAVTDTIITKLSLRLKEEDAKKSAFAQRHT